MLFKNITILDENFAVKSGMYVAVEKERIAYIGSERPAGDYGREYEGRGRLLMPGFYNSHAHSPMALMRGYGENLALQDWLNKKIFPFEDQLDGNAVYALASSPPARCITLCATWPERSPTAASRPTSRGR